MLVEDERCDERRDDDLEGEDRRRHARRGRALQRAGIEQDAQQRGSGHQHGPADRMQRLAAAERVAEQLRRERGERERRACADHDRRRAAAPARAQPARHDRQQRDDGERRAERGDRPVGAHGIAALRRGDAERCDAEQHRSRRRPLRARHRLAERAPRERQQQHRAEAERRLHHGQRRQREREDLERPSRRAERRPE
ncbi:MAG TPA: hypothetical protein VFT42_08465, partial [Solirubrobacteraceae bacterium]|nr:hypothetical protein [Solirubrobacteraceae bacterium]